MPDVRQRFPHLPAALPAAVVFDMDGLMLDTERLDRALWQAAARRHAFEFPDWLHATLVGRRAADTAHTLQAHFGAGFPLERIKAEIHGYWMNIATGPGLPRKPGIDDLLATLERQAIPRAVATSTARDRALLSLGELATRFQALAFGNEVQRGKPAPDIYLLAAQRLGVPPADCLALEDSPAGVAAAHAAGMTVVMIPDLVQPHEPPPFLGASLDEIHEWVQALLERAPGPEGFNSLNHAPNPR